MIKWFMKTRVGDFQHIGKNAYAYEPASMTYRKFLWWQIPVEKVIEHPVVARAKRIRDIRKLRAKPDS